MLKSLDIKHEYRTSNDDIVGDFLVPLLSESVQYQRAVGFFSSSALSEAIRGIKNLIDNGGNIQIVASPKLSDDDINAIKQGYEDRKTIIENALLRELSEPENDFERKRLNILTHLISIGKLDIKIAVVESKSEIGMYHEKLGIFTDAEGNKVVFTGSLNESRNAYINNFESVDVYCTWDDPQGRALSKVKSFEAIWDNLENTIEVYEFSKIKEEILNKYQYEDPDYSVEEEEIQFVMSQIESYNKKIFFGMPEKLNLYDYQKEAIEAWKENDYRGIFDMATGTGKTLTGLGAVSKLSAEKRGRLGVVIVCPYQHLVEQWVEDIREFGVNPIICYSSYNWKGKFADEIMDFSLGIIDNFCVITTNATFVTDAFQREINTLSGDVCLLVDEAHNFGAPKQIKCMKEVYKYRLALSATLERHHDEEGTECIKKYFGKKCIEYNLERAIEENKLTPYYYFPITVVLEEDETKEYSRLSEKINKMMIGKGEKDLPDALKHLLIKRSRLVAGARGKVPALKKLIGEKFIQKNNLLVYCGATRVTEYVDESTQPNEDDERQIDAVVNILGNELGMRVSRFTSEEDKEQRESIKRDFSEGRMCQAIVAIKCLDEGMNIPGIETAFILASSTNPKEYIQRRGRVLRKSEGKNFAYLYDFVVLPRNLNDGQTITGLPGEAALVKKEFTRIEEFSRLSVNPADSMQLQEEIINNYNLDLIMEIDYEY